MVNYLGKALDTLASNYWFIPGVMALGAFITAAYLTQSEFVYRLDSSPLLGWLHYFEPTGARALMGTIAGSMITVAGVTFSITISAIVHATSQFGPRLLTNFMQDRANQFTLGTFIATFLYCLVVLSSIRDSSTVEAAFVPYLAVLIGLGFAVASTAVLIYFVHHVPASIHASHVISSIGTLLVDEIRDHYVTRNQAEGPSGEILADSTPAEQVSDMQAVRSPFTGYVQFLDADKLCAIALELDTLIILNAKPGDFVSFGDFLAWVGTDQALDDDTAERIGDYFLCGNRRTPAQDLRFLANELVEIATRALSPGINDPFTAMLCIDWLGSAFAVIAGRHSRRYAIQDGQGNLRLLIPMTTGTEFIIQTLDKLAPYVSRDRNATLHLQAMLGRLLINTRCTGGFDEVQTSAGELCERAAAHLDDGDAHLVRQRNEVLQSISIDAAQNAAICRQHHWLGGSN